jgi:hypothetical protein
MTVLHDITPRPARFSFSWVAQKVKEATPYQRGNAIFVLGVLKQENAVEILVSLLREKSEGRRLLVLSALRRIGGDRARKALHDQLAWGEASLAERSYAVEFLGQIGMKEDADLLEKLARRRTRGCLPRRPRAPSSISSAETPNSHQTSGYEGALAVRAGKPSESAV